MISKGKQDKIEDLYMDGVKYELIALEIGVQRDTVARHIKRANLPKRERATPKKFVATESQLERIEVLYLEGLSWKEVSQRLSIPVSYVSKHLSELGISRGRTSLRGEEHLCDSFKKENSSKYELLRLRHAALLQSSVERSSVPSQKDFVSYFWDNAKFMSLYRVWILHGKVKTLLPSLDHILARKHGGTDSLSNLRFITWTENLSKSSLRNTDWEILKADIRKNVGLYFPK